MTLRIMAFRFVKLGAGPDWGPSRGGNEYFVNLSTSLTSKSKAIIAVLSDSFIKIHSTCVV